MSVFSLPVQRHSDTLALGWVDTLFTGLVIYVGVCVLWMLTGLGGEQVRHYVGLLSDVPACVVALALIIEAARRLPKSSLRSAWRCLSVAYAMYLVGTLTGIYSWLHGVDPFPGVSDVFYFAYYPVVLAAVGLMIKAAAVRVRWTQFLFDAVILVVGFGAFFWFLIIRPAALSTEVSVLKNALSQAYLALNCVLVLALGVLLLAGAATAGGRRVSLLLALGTVTMLFADIAWSVAKVTGHYIPGDLQDILYITSYVALAAAARAQMQPAAAAAADAPGASVPTVFAHALPYAAMLTAVLVLVTLTSGDIRSPATVMTLIVFGLALLVMARQAVVLREEALLRERRAARLVEDRYASLIANASDVIMIVAVDGSLRFASPASERTFGLLPEELGGRNLLELCSGEDSGRLRAFLAELATTFGDTVGPVEINIARGLRHYVLDVVGSNLTRDPAVQGLALNFRDITERKALEEQLRQLAFHDALTLLANRSLFRDRVQHSVALAQRNGRQVAVMFLDLDNFKHVNDSLGHETGDRLLQAVAHRLVQSTRSSDTVARLGGDEFAILVEGFAAPAEVRTLAALLVARLDEPFTLNATEVQVSASIGVAFSTDESGADALLSRADMAMYHAKTSGKNRYIAFQEPMQEQRQERMRLEADIARAVSNEEFFIEYQPIIDLGTRSLLGVEALLRWRHPELGVLLPGKFIQIAEECGQIAKLGRWVLARACCELQSWRHTVAGGTGLRVAVNISGRHLQHGELVLDVTSALEESGLEPGNLVIELTESTIMHNTEVNLARLTQLKSLGVRLAIDDFGTGYSSLSYLHRFPIDILKIDRSFVSRLTNTYNGSELARAVITLGETLGLDTIAEGIELEPQVDALLALGCVAGQGFLFAGSGTLEVLSASPFVARRNELWSAGAAAQDLSPTGRYAALGMRAGAA